MIFPFMNLIIWRVILEIGWNHDKCRNWQNAILSLQKRWHKDFLLSTSNLQSGKKLWQSVCLSSHFKSLPSSCIIDLVKLKRQNRTKNASLKTLHKNIRAEMLLWQITFFHEKWCINAFERKRPFYSWNRNVSRLRDFIISYLFYQLFQHFHSIRNYFGIFGLLVGVNIFLFSNQQSLNLIKLKNCFVWFGIKKNLRKKNYFWIRLEPPIVEFLNFNY